MGLSAEEERILASIHVASENDPLRPEFPPNNPRFPATPTVRISVPGFREVLYKDESHNLTGTHKDRLAWEMVVTYKDMLLAKRKGAFRGSLPQLSIITSGCAGAAIQTILKRYRLPALKCLVDYSLSAAVKQHLVALGCEVYEEDLSRKAFSWQDILLLTDNPRGIDVTSAAGLDPATRFYDWLSYEVLNSNPEYCFIPFGSGHLYENILNVCKTTVASSTPDPRFRGDATTIQNCHFLGATVNRSDSKADKLFAAHRPFAGFEEQWIRCYRLSGFVGMHSDVHVVKERFLDEALALIDEQGIVAEASGVAGLALLLQLREQIPSEKRVLILGTGKLKLS